MGIYTFQWSLEFSISPPIPYLPSIHSYPNHTWFHLLLTFPINSLLSLNQAVLPSNGTKRPGLHPMILHFSIFDEYTKVWLSESPIRAHGAAFWFHVIPSSPVPPSLMTPTTCCREIPLCLSLLMETWTSLPSIMYENPLRIPLHLRCLCPFSSSHNPSQSNSWDVESHTLPFLQDANFIRSNQDSLDLIIILAVSVNSIGCFVSSLSSVSTLLSPWGVTQLYLPGRLTSFHTLAASFGCLNTTCILQYGSGSASAVTRSRLRGAGRQKSTVCRGWEAEMTFPSSAFAAFLSHLLPNIFAGGLYPAVNILPGVCTLTYSDCHNRNFPLVQFPLQETFSIAHWWNHSA